MIPIIGIMIGFYVITRMISLLTRKEQREESPIVKVFAVITLIVTVFSIFSLFTSGAK